MSNPEASVLQTKIVGEEQSDRLVILSRGLPKKGNIFDFKGGINVVPDEVLPPTYRDNGLFDGREVIKANADQKSRKG